MTKRDFNLQSVTHVELGHILLPVYLRGTERVTVRLPHSLDVAERDIRWPIGTLKVPYRADTGETLFSIPVSGAVLIRDGRHGGQIVPINQAVRLITKT